VSPNTVRANDNKDKGNKYSNKKNQQASKKARHEEAQNAQPVDPLADVWR